MECDNLFACCDQRLEILNDINKINTNLLNILICDFVYFYLDHNQTSGIHSRFKETGNVKLKIFRNGGDIKIFEKRQNADTSFLCD